MKKSLRIALAIVAVALWGTAAMAQTFNYPVRGKQGFSLTEKNRDGLHLTYEVGQVSFNSIDFRGEALTEVNIKAVAIPNDAGKPNLPTDSRMMAIPQGATAQLRVVSFEKETLHNVNIAPALRIQSENEEPEMNYVKDLNVYSKDAFYPAEPFTLGNSYIRGVDAVTVSITPFQYNPVTRDLIVYTHVELAIEFEGGNGHFGEDRLRSPYWDPILAAELLNYDQLPAIDYEARMQRWLRNNDKGAEYLIVTPNNDAWAEFANQLKEYRTRQGIITDIYRLDEMPANNTNDIKAWFHNAYNTWEIAPVAVCLLGDHGTNLGQYIPAETVPHPYENTCITDNRYADPSGDNLPDMVFSRLVAQNAEEAQMMVSKQIEYEYTNPNMDPNFYSSPVTALGWQTERWFQICSEVVGGYFRLHGYNPNRINCIYSGTPGSSWSSNQNTSMVVNYFGPNGMGYIPQSPSELGGWSGGSPEQVVQAVNQGTFWVQHRDHGYNEGWGEPAVSNSHVYQMNNVGNMPFVMSINCQTGMFDYTGSNNTCFAEAWMRRTYNDENAGAVGILCPTQVSYSFVNDTYVWGVYDLFDGDFMPDYGPYAANTGNWMPAFGNVAGKYFLAQSNWPSNPESKDITYTMFTAHCDAFLRIYTQVPQEMEVTHPEVVIAGLGEITITAPEGCMISLVKENAEGGWEILAVAEATGDPQTISFEPQVPPTEINLVVTGQNYLRYEAIMGVIPADGPYIVYDSKVLHDQNENDQLDFGESVSLDVTLKNVGSDPMEAFEAVLATDSEYITITNGTAQYEGIAPNDMQTVENAFSFIVADNVPDNTSNRFTITVTNGDDVFVSNIAIKAYAPVFNLGNMSITEIDGNGNGRLDAGETARLSFPIENRGHANAAYTTAVMHILSPYITVEETAVEFEQINAGETQTAVYAISVSEDTPTGYTCDFQIDITSGQYSTQKEYTAKVGLVIEDFESGTLGSAWTNDANFPWRVVTEEPYEGQYCVRSGSIGDNSTTTLILSHEAGSADTISFYYKVSSESNWDKLHFYIDNMEQDNWSGTVNWTKASYRVNAGHHTYKWTYTKDTYQSSGSDCAWIDFVSLPSPRVMAGTAGPDVTACGDNEVQIIGYAIYYNNLQWTTSGDGSFDDATIATPLYTPGPQDIANGQATLTITITGDGHTITDEMMVFVKERTEIYDNLAGQHYCAIDEPQPIAVGIIGEYVSFKWLTDGDGEFEDATALETTYTPGLNDINNGVTLTAFAVSPGCGSVTYDYPFEMNQMPNIEFHEPNLTVQVCQGQNRPWEYSAEGFIEGLMMIDVDGVTVNIIEGQPFEFPTATLKPGFHTLTLSNLSNGYCTGNQELSFEIEVIETPVLTVDQTEITICEGEHAQFEFTVTGGDTSSPVFVLTGDAPYDYYWISGHQHTFMVSPSENTQIHLSQITAWASGEGENCPNDIDITLTINVNPMMQRPEVSGDNELDVRLTPTTRYTVTNDVTVGFSIEPEEAGTLVPTNDGKTVDITWSDSYKGEVTLTAMPTAECYTSEGLLTINVKNSTDVNEYNINASLYPNPTDGNVTIEAEAMQRLTVVNELGQVVYDTEVSNDTETLNMSQFGTGVYMIRIYTKNGMGVKRVSIIR